MTPRRITLLAIALLALAWPLLPPFTVTLLDYIGLYCAQRAGAETSAC